MSRIGKKGIEIPDKTEVTVTGNTVKVKGPLGELSREFKPIIKIEVVGNQVNLTPVKENLETKAMWGTYASLIKNMVEGVNKFYERKLVVEGIGYKADIKGTELTLNVGFSHQVKVQIPANLKVVHEKGVLTITGTDKEAVGRFAAETRSIKKPEPYKGKGIHYSDEVVRRKEGKKAA
jgi:large subunit ribosomal protein L6